MVAKYLREPGVEIGAFLTPIPNIKPYYVDRFESYANQKTLADYFGDACALPFQDSSLNYVAASHVIEHVANPLAALKEWYRVLKSKGIIYMVVPDRRYTFDRPRPLTNVDHIIEDYHRGVTQVDGTHIDEFVFGVDWTLFSPATSPDKVEEEKRTMADAYRVDIANNREINIHFHTYEPESMVRLFEKGCAALKLAGKIKILEVLEKFPSNNPIGFLIVAQVRKPWIEQLKSSVAKRRATYPLRQVPERFNSLPRVRFEWKTS